MSQIVKVLLLDKYADYLQDLSARDITMEVTHELVWNPNVYEATKATIAKIQELTAIRSFDIVVLGNNLGAGIIKASAIHQRLHGRTVVVWNDEYFAGREKYETLGFKKFMARSSLRAFVINFVTN